MTDIDVGVVVLTTPPTSAPEVLVAKYSTASMGCDPVLLQSIALTVWEIPAPSTPA